MATGATFENEGTPQERENGKRQSKISQQILSPAEWAPVEDEMDARYQRYGKNDRRQTVEERHQGGWVQRCFVQAGVDVRNLAGRTRG